MAFDAGTIIARMDLDDSDFDRRLRADVAKIEAFEQRSHEIKLTPKVDEADTSQARRAFQRLDQQITNDARSRSRAGNGSLLGTLIGLFRGGGGAAAAGQAAGAGGGFLSSLGSAAGPGILGIGAKPALIGAAIPVAAAALPSLFGVAGTAAGGGLGLGVAGLLGMQAAKPAMALASAREQAQQAMAAAVTPAQRQAAATQLQAVNQQVAKLSPALHSIFTSISQIQTWWQNFTKSLAPMLAPALRQIVPMITSLGPAIKQMFAGAMTIVVPFMRALTSGLKEIMPLLGQMFRVSAPGFAVLTSGLLMLVRNILPGLTTLIKATAPVMGMFARTLGTLGADLGKMFAIMAPAVKPSMIILDSLLKAVGGLLPIIGKFAVVSARLLAPVFVVLGKVVAALLPILGSLAKILAEFAAAAIQDLVVVLGAVATLLKDLSPSFAILAKVAGQVFRTLENSGVFQVLADALEKLAPPLAKMINALVKGLVPVLPPVIKFIESLTGILTTGLVNAVLALLPPLTKLALVVIQALVELLPVLLPLFTELVGLLTPVLVRIVQDLADALTAVISAVPASVLRDIALGFLAIWAAIKIGGLIAAVSNPVTLIAVAVGLLIVGIVELVKHWHQVWTDIKNWAKDAWEFLTHGWGQYLFPGLFLIRKTVEFVRDHWRQAWDDIKGAALDAWHFIHDDIISPLVNTFTQTLPNAFRTAVKAIGTAWDDIRDVVRAPIAWVVDHVLDGLISVFDHISGIVHGPQISQVHPFGLQTGGRIPGYGGGDRHMALLEGGEAVVSKETTSANASTLAAWGVPGFQGGGRVGNRAPGQDARFGPLNFTGGPNIGGFFKGAYSAARIAAAVFSGNKTALTNAINAFTGHGVGGASGDMASLLTALPAMLVKDAVNFLVSQFGGSGNEIVKYALSFLDKIPYTWGGTSFSGDDCSGFTQGIYKHFGYNAPRTSEAQGAWVNKGAPVPGGLVFFNSPAGGPPPGHVGIVMDASRMISQAGPEGVKGPSIGSMLGRMFTGVPPGGLKGGTSARGSWTLPGLEGLWDQAGGPPGLAHIAGAIALAESSGNPRARNPSGASGLWQILGQVFPGNIMNPFVNALNAVTKYKDAGGFSPWVTYTSGAYRQFMDSGGWLPPGGMNGTGRPEAVLNPGQSQAFLNLAEAAHRLSRGGGDGALLRDVHLMLPEGTTLAEALREIGWALRTTRQQSFAGVPGG